MSKAACQACADLGDCPACQLNPGGNRPALGCYFCRKTNPIPTEGSHTCNRYRRESAQDEVSPKVIELFGALKKALRSK